MKKVVKEIVENRGGKSVSKAMRDAGYSDAYAKNPQQFIATQKWQKLMKKYLSDDLLLKKHKRLLDSHRIQQQYFNYKITDKSITKIFRDNDFQVIGIKRFMKIAIIFYLAPDNDTQDKALDKAYKLKGYYAKENPQAAVQININEDREKFKYENL